MQCGCLSKLLCLWLWGVSTPCPQLHLTQHSLFVSHTQTHRHRHTHSHTQTHRHTHTHSHTHTLTHRHTHTHTHTTTQGTVAWIRWCAGQGERDYSQSHVFVLHKSLSTAFSGADMTGVADDLVDLKRPSRCHALSKGWRGWGTCGLMGTEL